MNLGKYSFGIGDRFNHQGKALLKALQMVREAGIEIIPVWNKSNREHQIVKSTPEQTRVEADEAVAALQWDLPYFVDADHISLLNVDKFINHCDFFTIDVADYIGKPPVEEDIEDLIGNSQKYIGKLNIPGIDSEFYITEELLTDIGTKFLNATQEAGKIYRYIKKCRAGKDFIPEISMDEVNDPQTPVELFCILGLLAGEKIPVQTIAPRFTGRFNKGVDYKGDPDRFRLEFEQDLLVIDHAIRIFGLPENLKLSIHSGSDKFSIYPVVGELIRKYDKGIHIKTAGTTWLEEVTGLAKAGDEGLNMAKTIYRNAYARKEELCKPYTTVIEIDESSLPLPDHVDKWDGNKYSNTLRHIPDHPEYNPNFRQLLHVGYKVAAELGEQYINSLEKFSDVIEKNVTENIFERHIKRLCKI
ncbi:MAG: hypothetical protein AMS27_06075 [Bacteroides sp. SM23_62_1]|nr:MAG: hypothetical protein AMS27_06075 [Bacteroides sp. SM23_62_1]